MSDIEFFIILGLWLIYVTWSEWKERRMAYDSADDTKAHIESVQRKIGDFQFLLGDRATVHDMSKLENPEKGIFDLVTPKLKALTYGSPEYAASLKEMGAALDHHYAHNSHHPQHYTNGVNGMSLLDLVEMFCDWKAATERHANGDFAKSIEINRERFAISDQLAEIFENTRKELNW